MANKLCQEDLRFTTEELEELRLSLAGRVRLSGTARRRRASRRQLHRRRPTGPPPLPPLGTDDLNLASFPSAQLGKRTTREYGSERPSANQPGSEHPQPFVIAAAAETNGIGEHKRDDDTLQGISSIGDVQRAARVSALMTALGTSSNRSVAVSVPKVVPPSDVASVEGADQVQMLGAGPRVALDEAGPGWAARDKRATGPLAWPPAPFPGDGPVSSSPPPIPPPSSVSNVEASEGGVDRTQSQEVRVGIRPSEQWDDGGVMTSAPLDDDVVDTDVMPPFVEAPELPDAMAPGTHAARSQSAATDSALHRPVLAEAAQTLALLTMPRAAADGLFAEPPSVPLDVSDRRPLQEQLTPDDGIEEGRVAEGSSDEQPWFENIFDEDFLRTVPYATAGQTVREVDFLVESLGPAPDDELLDVGCGTGRHCIEFAARGYRVTGVDTAVSLLVKGAEEAQKRGVQVNLIHKDMRALDVHSRYQAVYCMNNTFGFFDDDANRRLLQTIHRSLVPRGRLLVDVLNRDYVLRDLPLRVGWEGDGCVVLEEVDFNYFTSRLRNKRSIVFMDGRHLEQDILIRCYSLHEMGKILYQAGFRVLEVSGHIAHRGSFFGDASRSLIVLAERLNS